MCACVQMGSAFAGAAHSKHPTCSPCGGPADANGLRKNLLIFYELVAKCHTELLLEEVVSNLLSREVQVQCSHFSNLNDWLQSSLLSRLPLESHPCWTSIWGYLTV